MAMKVAELKEELEARGEGKTGNKAWLRRRLHAAILHDYLEVAPADEGIKRERERDPIFPRACGAPTFTTFTFL